MNANTLLTATARLSPADLEAHDPLAPSGNDALRLWQHIYGDATDLMAIFSGRRETPDAKDMVGIETAYFRLPDRLAPALAEVERQDRLGRETYHCAHLLTKQSRRKENAADVLTLYADCDAGQVPTELPPTALVESGTPGHLHAYWRMTRRIPPAQAERLSQALARLSSADPSGYDLTQLLRPPGTHNHKHAEPTPVRLVHLDDSTTYDPDELARILAPYMVADRPRQVRRSRGETPTATETPPVRLSGSALARWQGELQVARDDGALDRSASLFAIGLALAVGGATAPTIAAALAERDQTLGFRKYTERDDADTRYWEIAERATTERETEPEPDPDAPACLDCRRRDQRLTQLERANQKLKAKAADLYQTHMALLALLKPKHLRAHALTLFYAAVDLASAARRGRTDEHGFLRVTQGPTAKAPGCSLAERVNRSGNAVGDDLDWAHKQGYLKKELRPAQTTIIDPRTGEIKPKTIQVTYIAAEGAEQGTAALLLRWVASAGPAPVEKRGGRQQPRCPDHPEAPLRHVHEQLCAVCGRVVAAHETRTTTAEPPEPPPDPGFTKFVNREPLATPPVDVPIHHKVCEPSAPGAAPAPEPVASQTSRTEASEPAAWRELQPDPPAPADNPALSPEPTDPERLRRQADHAIHHGAYSGVACGCANCLAAYHTAPPPLDAAAPALPAGFAHWCSTCPAGTWRPLPAQAARCSRCARPSRPRQIDQG